MEYSIQIDVFADVVCPWCRIGKARLSKALDQFPSYQFTQRWRPFQLQPSIPANGVNWQEFTPQKFGGASQADAMFQRVAEVGSSEGLTFRFDKVATAPNTVDAHRLILLASQSNKTWQMVEQLYTAYFEKGADLNNEEALVALAQNAGLERENVVQLLHSEALKDEVIHSQIQAQQLDITGVPFFIINQRYGISGAQPTELFVEALDRAASEMAARD